MPILVSPTDRDLLAALGEEARSHSLPETCGADVLILTPTGRFGLQRKQFPNDFLASLRDGRLVREVGLLETLEMRVVCIEGKPTYTTNGYLMDPFANRWTRKAIEGIERSLRLRHHIDVWWTENIWETVGRILELRDWLGKPSHRSLLQRPPFDEVDHGSKLRDGYGAEKKKQAKGLYLLQGLEGIGPGLAEAIYDHFGRVPWRWDCAPEELGKVSGIGGARSKLLWEGLS